MQTLTNELQPLFERLRQAEADLALLNDFSGKGGEFRLSIRVETECQGTAEAVRRVSTTLIRPATIMSALMRAAEMEAAAAKKALLETTMGISLNEGI